jgi:hypothetical protein
MPDRMSGSMSDEISDRMLDRISERMPERIFKIIINNLKIHGRWNARKNAR